MSRPRCGEELLAPGHTPPPELGHDAVHVWRAVLDQPAAPVAAMARHLSAEETARADTLAFAQGRRRFVVGRGLLRVILSWYLRVAPAAVPLDRRRDGKPELRGGSRLRFNVTHSAGIVLYAVAWGREVGIDLEVDRPLPRVARIAARALSSRERAVLFRIAPSLRPRAFLQCWTRKEACMKATGEGLVRPPAEVEVTVAPAERPRLLSIGGDRRAARRWELADLVGLSSAVATVAVEGSGWQLGRFLVDPAVLAGEAGP